MVDLKSILKENMPVLIETVELTYAGIPITINDNFFSLKMIACGDNLAGHGSDGFSRGTNSIEYFSWGMGDEDILSCRPLKPNDLPLMVNWEHYPDYEKILKGSKVWGIEAPIVWG